MTPEPGLAPLAKSKRASAVALLEGRAAAEGVDKVVRHVDARQGARQVLGVRGVGRRHLDPLRPVAPVNPLRVARHRADAVPGVEQLGDQARPPMYPVAPVTRARAASLIGSVWVRRDRRAIRHRAFGRLAAAVVLAHHAPRPRPPRGAADIVDDAGHLEAADHEGVDEHAARHDDGKLDEEEQQRDDRQRAECGGQDEARGGRRWGWWFGCGVHRVWLRFSRGVSLWYPPRLTIALVPRFGSGRGSLESGQG